MAYTTITTKVVGSTNYNEAKILATDVNQIRQAIQTGDLDLKPNNIHMEGNEITADGGQSWIRRSGNKFQYYDAGTWKEVIEASNTASFTAGENIAIRDVVYLNTSDNKIYKASTSNYDWIGVAKEAITSTSTGEVYMNGSITGGFSSLTPGKWYGLNSTAGTISATNINKVGLAISATQIVSIKQTDLEGYSNDIKTYNLAVTTSTDTIDLSAINYKNTILIRNVGAIACYFTLTGTATTDGMYLVSGAEIKLVNVSFDNVSAITSSGTTTLSVSVFTGTSETIGIKTNSEIKKLSVTDATSTIDFTNTTSAKDVLIINEGISSAYLSISGTAALTDFKLDSDAALNLNTNKYSFAAITAANTTTIKILGVY